MWVMEGLEVGDVFLEFGMNGVNFDGDEFFSFFFGYYSILLILIFVNVRRIVICIFMSNVGEIFYIFVLSSKYFCSCCYYFFKFGVVYVY